MTGKKCNHNWQDTHNNKYTCSLCGITKYKQFPIDEYRYYIITDNGVKQTHRKDPNRYFYPDEWNKFMQVINKKKKEWHRLVFETLIKTGGRIEEVLFIRGMSLSDDKRKTLKLFTTKTKSSKGEIEGKPRSFQIDSKLYNKLKRIGGDNRNKYLFLNVDPNTEKKEIKKLARNKAIILRSFLKRNLKKIGVKDYYNFSLHNIRKTHGMWLKTLDIEVTEILNRLGHDYDTFVEHYSSPSLFDRKDRQEMIKILGDIYGLK